MAKEVSLKRTVKSSTPNTVVVKKPRLALVVKAKNKKSLATKTRSGGAKGLKHDAYDTMPILTLLTPSNVIRERILAKVRADSQATKARAEDSASFMAGEPPLRMREKVAIFRRIVSERGPAIMANVAKVSGYTFIFFGLLFLYAQALMLPSGALKQVATALCVGQDCPAPTSVLHDEQPPTTLAPEPPRVTFLSVPQRVTEETMISLQLENVNDHSLSLISHSNGRKYEITEKRNSASGRVDYLIRLDSVPSGIYKVRAIVTGLTGAVVSVVANTPLEIVAPVPAPAPANNTEIAKLESNNDADDVQQKPKPEPSVVTTPEIKPEVIPTVPVLSIQAESDSLHKVTLTGYNENETLAIFATLVQSVTPQFLGIMFRGSDQYIYWLDTKDLPSGRYELKVSKSSDPSVVIARTIFAHVRTATSSVPVREGPLPRVAVAPAPRAPVAPKPKVVPVPNVNPESPESDETPDVSELVNREADDKARELMERDSVEYTELTTRVIMAIESNNPELRRLAERELDARIRATLREASLSTSDITVSDLERQLRKRAEEVIERGSRLSNLDDSRRFTDSDGDGISDYDEIYLYGTDLRNPDTDGDGTLDGVEIVLGFDALDPNPEAVITYESPREVSYVNDTKLGIWSVEPLVEYTEDMAVTSVKAVISGFGLPNSFVTLYIFSTPTIVKVRTGDDGSFRYTFTRELEDGEHEVYVAITDNTGAIVVRSSPFRFTKIAQAFTYADEAVSNQELAITPISNESVVSYYLVAAMGVVSFGVILLMLGYFLRRRDESTIVTT